MFRKAVPTFGRLRAGAEDWRNSYPKSVRAGAYLPKERKLINCFNTKLSQHTYANACPVGHPKA